MLISKTLEKKGWLDSVTLYKDMEGDAVYVVDTYGDTIEKIEKFLDACEVEWAFADSGVVDHDDGIFYYNPTIGEYDWIMGEGEILGKARFDNDELGWEDIKDDFVNVATKALPSWFKALDDFGWTERSCDFANGWYGRNDQPEEIMKKLEAQGLDVVFQLANVSMFETTFCVWTRDMDVEDILVSMKSGLFSYRSLNGGKTALERVGKYIGYVEEIGKRELFSDEDLAEIREIKEEVKILLESLNV